MRQRNPQSWFDLEVMPTLDPRSIVQTMSFEDQGGTMRQASFARSTSWLQSTVWKNTPLSVTTWSAPTTPNLTVPNAYDYDSQQTANAWNSLVAMTVPPLASAQPLATQKIMFLKAGTAFVNNIYLDFAAGVTSQDIQFSFRDNSTTSGDFTNSSIGTVPVFAFPTAPTYGGGGRNLQVTLIATGRFQVALRVVDNTGNWSLYEMEWIVV